MKEEYHIPVLLHQSVEGLNINPEGIYVDVTFGGGGHSKEILNRLTTGRLIAFDQDPDVFTNIPKDDRLIFARSNFRYLKNFLRYYGYPKVDGILADLGVSSHHFDDASRGFSFRFDGELDMRMNKASNLSAKEVINNYTEEQLADVFYYYGELRNSRRIAKEIAHARHEKPLNTIGEFQEALKRLTPPHQERKFLAKVFQAIRIEVNREMEVLKELLQQTEKVLKPGGRLVVITYHSLEDRLVKNFIKNGGFEGSPQPDLFGQVQVPFKAINRKIISPSEEEIERNPRARSAKLRIAERQDI